MSANNSNSDNQEDLMKGFFRIITFVIGGYLCPIIGMAMLPLLFGCFAMIIALLFSGSIGSVWDETVEAIIVFADFGRVFSPITAILFLLGAIFSPKKE